MLSVSRRYLRMDWPLYLDTMKLNLAIELSGVVGIVNLEEVARTTTCGT
jgi:hypothetical protein